MRAWEGLSGMAGIDVVATAFSGANAAFIAEMYAKWAADPRSVDPMPGDVDRLDDG